MPDIPVDEHIVRAVSSGFINEDNEITSAAFQLKRGEEYLSVCRLEHFSTDDVNTEEALINQVKIDISHSYTLNDSHQLAVLNVGNTKTYVSEETPDSTSLEFCKEPSKIKSHSGIYNISPHPDLFIAELIAETVCSSYKVGEL